MFSFKNLSVDSSFALRCYYLGSCRERGKSLFGKRRPGEQDNYKVLTGGWGCVDEFVILFSFKDLSVDSIR